MAILYIKIKGLSYALVSIVQCIGCSIANKSLGMYKQQDAQSLLSYSLQDFSSVENRQVTGDVIKTLYRKEKIVWLDFLNTVFSFERETCSGRIESEIFPANKDTIYTFDAMVCSLGADAGIKTGNMAVAIFHGKIQLWQKRL